MKCDRLFYNGIIYNTAFRKFFRGFLAVTGDKVVYTGAGEKPEDVEAAETVDLEGRAVVPGLIDVHMHIESSMLTPRAYADEAVRHGVTTVVSEPHEIANVAGVPGVKAMIEAGKGAAIDIFYGIPSCVPSTSRRLETAGAEIGVPELLELLKCPEVKCLGEVMNTRSVLDEPDGKSNRLIRAFLENAPGLPAEGHVPRIVGEELARYMMSGVDSDHTEHSLDELAARWFNGFCVQVQEKTLKQEVVDYLCRNSLYDNTCFVTDDVMADEMLRNGILDHILRKAMRLGMPAEQALYCCTMTPALRMRLWDRGELRPNKKADFVVLDDVETFDVHSTYKNGVRAYLKGDPYVNEVDCSAFSGELYDSVKLKHLFESDFALRTEREGIVTCRVARVSPDRTQTAETEMKLEAKDGEILFEGAGVCGFAVFERYGINGNRARGLVNGSVIRRGAVATTYSHDSHNLCVLGCSKADMAAAANTVISMKGGMAVVEDGNVIASAAMPIGGILTDRSASRFAEEIGDVTKALRYLGYEHEDPIMSLCVLALPVSPYLKFSDVGIIDVPRQALVDLVK